MYLYRHCLFVRFLRFFYLDDSLQVFEAFDFPSPPPPPLEPKPEGVQHKGAP